MVKYMVHFCETEQEAKEFKRSRNGQGIIYKNTPRSRSKDDYQVSRAIMQDSNPKPDEFYESHPVVVAWNEIV